MTDIYRTFTAAAALSIAVLSCVSFNNYSRVNNPYMVDICRRNMTECREHMKIIDETHTAILAVGLVSFSYILLILFHGMYLVRVKK